ncbi:uncharacterized protein PADG_05066 [Paracoccidioides brasiliensis Pb18]|uniref:Uncharacterized protein n=1 Tax=Paracoccidioides brasiliensis (strain Pb18) TaxID=502780 RepID=C1GBR5_PARBD|nr:uncharacterized protein PADG_05066 [Paracoccidioides brasiliensis Pb18]EEH48987.2 hypothetical protein PADG_05066 [Paracoccidioides brasiliensis Pb18]
MQGNANVKRTALTASDITSLPAPSSPQDAAVAVRAVVHPGPFFVRRTLLSKDLLSRESTRNSPPTETRPRLINGLHMVLKLSGRVNLSGCSRGGLAEADYPLLGNSATAPRLVCEFDLQREEMEKGLSSTSYPEAVEGLRTRWRVSSCLSWSK